jgi:hypothetical protein
MIDEVIKQIEEQQKGQENTPPYYVGEQLKDIIRNNPQAAEKENAELKQTIEKLQKESQVGSNEKMVKLQMCFEQAQNSIIAVKTALAAVEGSEKYDKLFAAVKETLKGKVEEI